MKKLNRKQLEYINSIAIPKNPSTQDLISLCEVVINVKEDFPPEVEEAIKFVEEYENCNTDHSRRFSPKYYACIGIINQFNLKS